MKLNLRWCFSFHVQHLITFQNSVCFLLATLSYPKNIWKPLNSCNEKITGVLAIQNSDFFHGRKQKWLATQTYLAKQEWPTSKFCRWKKSCTSWYGKYPIIYRVGDTSKRWLFGISSINRIIGSRAWMDSKKSLMVGRQSFPFGMVTFQGRTDKLWGTCTFGKHNGKTYLSH